MPGSSLIRRKKRAAAKSRLCRDVRKEKKVPHPAACPTCLPFGCTSAATTVLVPPRAPHEGWATHAGRSPGSRFKRLRSAFPTVPLMAHQWLFGGGLPLTVAGAAMDLGDQRPHHIPFSSSPSGLETGKTVIGAELMAESQAWALKEQTTRARKVGLRFKNTTPAVRFWPSPEEGPDN